MESVVDGMSSLLKTQNPAASTSTSLDSSRHHSPKQSRDESTSSTSYVTSQNHARKPVRHPNGSSVSNKKHPNNVNHDVQLQGFTDMKKHTHVSNKGKSELVNPTGMSYRSTETSFHKKVPLEGGGAKPLVKHIIDDSKDCCSSGSEESRDQVLTASKGAATQINDQQKSQRAEISCPSPQNSLYSTTLYAEAKQSFSNTEVSECASSIEKSCESVDITNSYDLDKSRKTSVYRGSTGSDISDESNSSSLSNTMYKPHKANDSRWEAMQVVRSHDGMLGLNHFRLLRRLGCGDIGSVYLSELTGTKTYFAMKVMDKAALASRKKLLRAQTEREILQSLDHPFLPTLYTHFETEKFSCLVMEFCPGGDLHALRQRQPGKFFPEHAARCEILFLSFSSFFLVALITKQNICHRYLILLWNRCAR